MHRTPFTVISGTDADQLDLVGVNLTWTLPNPVTVRHHLDLAAGALRRVVADAGGVIEDEWVQMDHPCLGCALRNEIVPGLIRLAESGRWDSIAVTLPTSAVPVPLARALDEPAAAAVLELTSTVAVIHGPQLFEDVYGDDLVGERYPEVSFDRRSIGEVLCEQVEFADVVVNCEGDLGSRERDLLRELIRPEATIVSQPCDLEADLLVGSGRDRRSAYSFVDPTRRRPKAAADLHPDEGILEVTRVGDLWTIHLDSWRPLHPERLLANIEILGGRGLRGRGCFWLPTRPDALAAWNGAGGQLSIGTVDSWHGRRPRTRLVITGTGDSTRVLRALEETLATEAELAAGSSAWSGDDGFDAWLGEVA